MEIVEINFLQPKLKKPHSFNMENLNFTIDNTTEKDCDCSVNYNRDAVQGILLFCLIWAVSCMIILCCCFLRAHQRGLDTVAEDALNTKSNVYMEMTTSANSINNGINTISLDEDDPDYKKTVGERKNYEHDPYVYKL